MLFFIITDRFLNESSNTNIVFSDTASYRNMKQEMLLMHFIFKNVALINAYCLVHAFYGNGANLNYKNKVLS